MQLRRYETPLKAWIKRSPFLRSTLRQMRSLVSKDRVSTDLTALNPTLAHATAAELRDAWRDVSIPARQAVLVEKQMADYRAGLPVPVFDALVDAVRPYVSAGETPLLLEIGCSSGYYSEVLRIKGLSVDYTGCDYSEVFIQMARERYPALPFDVEDAISLSYPDNSFDIAVSGACLLHIPEYQRAIAETARVARSFAVFHRTPVHYRLPTRFFTKKAYGVASIEIHFNEREIISCFRDNGLLVTDILTLDTEWRDGDCSAMKTYVCEKVAR
jgi:2-polyprenyl-3-methyl-5-hydroxy-6-metoxy-1,4-benzoquinol methylase